MNPNTDEAAATPDDGHGDEVMTPIQGREDDERPTVEEKIDEEASAAPPPDASSGIDHIGLVTITDDMLHRWAKEGRPDDDKMSSEGIEEGRQKNVEGDNNDQNSVVECTDGDARPWWKRYRKYIILVGASLVIVGVAVGVGVSVGSSSTDGASSSAEVPTNPPTQFCFPDRAELGIAVDEYIDQDCTNDSGCAAGKIYGWPMNSWCTSLVTDMSYLFEDKTTFTEDLTGWDTSSVTDMRLMFSGAKSYNGDISTWTVSNVTNMWKMFNGCEAFNSNISNWDVSRVTVMASTFYGATSFNSDISGWTVSSVSSMYTMFWGATKFNIDISSWDLSSATNMKLVFRYATSFDQDLCRWVNTFPYDSASGIFSGSGCTFRDDPQEFQQGPFCASSCEEQSATTSNRTSPSPEVSNYLGKQLFTHLLCII